MTKETIKTYLGILLLIPLGIILIVVGGPIFLIFLLIRQLISLWLILRFRFKHKLSEKHILFIYSNSPTWKEYIEDNLLPKLEKQSIFLNWSERSKWDSSQLEVKVFSHWAGEKEFNPMAIVLDKFLRVKTIRFYKAFKNRNHGDETLLKQKEEELTSYIN